MNMDEMDWDAYFERRSRIRYEWLKRWYNNRVDEARDKEMARHHFSAFLHMLDIITTPQGHFGQTTVDGKPVDYTYDITATYYAEVYDSFILTWQLINHKPVNTYLKRSLPQIVRRYRQQLVDSSDYVAQFNAQNEADEFAESHKGKKEIVNWLAFCAARDSIKTNIVPINDIDLESPVHTPFFIENDIPATQTQAINRSKKINKLPEIPKKENTFWDRYRIGEEVQELNNQSKATSLTDVMQIVAERQGVNKKTAERGYELKKYIDRNYPADRKKNTKGIYDWLISLTINHM